MSHDQLLEFLEQFSLERLGHIIAPHLRGRAVFNFEISFLDLVGQEKITNVERTGTLAGAALPVVLQQNGALVFLIQDVLFNIVSLSLHK